MVRLRGEAAEDIESILPEPGERAVQGRIPPPAVRRGREKGPETVLPDADDLRHGHPCERTAFHNGGGSKRRPGEGRPERKSPDCAAAGAIVPRPEKIYERKKYPKGEPVRHEKRKAPGPEQYLARDESVV